jgi:AraC-like DNA-binding protein
MWIDLIIYTPMYVTGFWALVLLLSSGKKNRGKQFLGIFMILAFGVYFSHALYFQNQYSAYLFFDPIYMFSSLSVYPMYYWYIKLLTVESGIKPGNLKMFLPALVFSLTTALVFVLMVPSERTQYLFAYLFRTEEIKTETTLVIIQRFVFIASRLIFMLQIFIFLILGRKLVLQYNSRIANFYSDLESKTIVWVNLLLYSFFVTSLMSIIFNLIGRSIFSGSVVLLLIPSVIFSVLLFFIGFQGYMQNYTVVDLVADEQDHADLSMKEYNQAQLKVKLLDLFANQEIYKNRDLKITLVSLKLQTNRTYVSNLINTEFKCTFSEFVNQYRIAEARKLLADSKQQNYSLDYVSEASGFGSIHSFIRIFKELEGITPGKYRDNKFLKDQAKL